MKKISYKEILIIALILIYAIIYNPIISKFLRTYLAYINIFFWIIIAIIGYFIIGYKKSRNITKKDTIQIVIIFTIIYLILTYFLGVFIGFATTPFSHGFFGILKNIIPFGIYIILREISRYILLDNQKNQKYIALVTIAFILVDVGISSISFELSSANEIFRFIGIAILGNSFKNILLTYMCRNTDFIPNIIYLLIMEGYIYIVPFVPNLGEYLETMFTIIFPVILILYLSKLYEEKDKGNKKRVKIHKIYFYIPFIILILIAMALISGVFRYGIYAIASDSMKPYFSRGDAIILEKYDKEKYEIKKDDVIVLKNKKRIYVHRVIKISKIDNSLVYTTKGDNNSTEDNFETKEKNIVGVAKFPIPLIGYPTVWLSEIIKE